ncbi:MAG: cupin domain-containing protein [Gammaproteobacteria bacterium]|nr:cupin domain-containing protein [Gammaproteobacteria bacterium]MDH5239306.1 cupin domain-containing protein [Gammaproteobacteria bacterium]MDH5260933.1 cupin domain-containing protein [Gammaproteobacteria bacterium]MDH5583359.1 cupin domain-containing protein [Gammaproteobacteria bacterium]
MSKSIRDLTFFDENTAEFSEHLTAVDKCVVGQPMQRTWNHFSSDDQKCFAGIWEAEPGCWKINYTENEFCQIQSGKSILRDAAGNERPLSAGDNFTIPAGFRGEWEVLETTRKIYVIYEPGN